MRLYWGTYAFGTNAVEVTNKTRAVISPQGLPLRYETDYDCTAVIDGTSQADLSKKENALRAALAVPYQDFVLKTDTGAPSSSAVFNKDTLSGTRVTRVEFNEAKDGEYVNRRTASFTVSAVYLIKSAANAVLVWRETVTIQGNGGPLVRWRYPVNGPGIPNQISPFSPVIATQSGQAVGHTRRAPRALPIWRQYLLNETDTKGSDSPELLGLAMVNWPVSWNYRFERGNGPLVGFAGLPIGSL